MVERNVVGWFEIPVENMDRAVEFYNSLFGWTIKSSPFGDGEFMAIFPADFTKDLPGAGGCLFKGKFTQPGPGPIVYFTSPSGDCTNDLVTAKELGAEILMERYEIPEGHGFMILLKDTEGNAIAVHSNK
jgi:hypothetical protein